MRVVCVQQKKHNENSKTRQLEARRGRMRERERALVLREAVLNRLCTGQVHLVSHQHLKETHTTSAQQQRTTQGPHDRNTKKFLNQ